MTTRDRLHVLMTADTVGGVWMYACELIRALAPLGVHVTLATMGARLSTSQARTAAALANADIVESTYALEWMPDPWSDVDAAGDWLLALARRAKPDVVHVNGYAHASLPFDAPVLSVAHSCVCSWFRAVRGTDAGPEWDEYRARVAHGLCTADAVVAPTHAILRAILDAHELAVAGRVIPNGRNSAAWRPTDKAQLVLSAGRLWDEAKGLDTLVASSARVAWPIHVAGATRGPDGSTADTGRVRALGELAPDDLAWWMARAAIYALPARYEPFGLSVLEAALAGCALVLGDIPTLRELWGSAAVYVPPNDPDALADAIAALARDPLRRNGLAAAARCRAAIYTPARMARGYRALYDELTGAGARHEEVA